MSISSLCDRGDCFCHNYFLQTAQGGLTRKLSLSEDLGHFLNKHLSQRCSCAFCVCVCVCVNENSTNEGYT